MNFESLPKAIVDFWQFLLDPLVTLALVAVIVWLLVGHLVGNWIHGIGRRFFAILSKENNKRVAKSYGLDKLLPIAALFIAISALHLSLVTVRFAGATIPPSLVYGSERMILSVVPAPTVVRIWAAFPDLGEFSGLTSLITRGPTMSKEERDKFTEDTRHWRERAAAYYGYFNLAKFMMALTVGCLVAGIWAGPRGTRWRTSVRAVGIIFVVLSAGLYFGSRFFYAAEQSARDHARSVEGIIVARTPALDAGKIEEAGKKYSQAAGPYGSQVWWEIRFFDRYYPVWLSRTFLNGQ